MISLVKATLFVLFVQIWYNNKGWPASIAFVNIFNNALLRSILVEKNQSTNPAQFGITGYSHPLPRTEIQIDSELQTKASLELFTAICIIFALAFVPSSFLVFLIDERVSNSKHLQFVSGLKGKTRKFVFRTNNRRKPIFQL